MLFDNINKFVNNQHVNAFVKCNKCKNLFAPGTLGVLLDTYLVPVSYILGVGVWHINAM